MVHHHNRLSFPCSNLGFSPATNTTGITTISTALILPLILGWLHRKILPPPSSLFSSSARLTGCHRRRAPHSLSLCRSVLEPRTTTITPPFCCPCPARLVQTSPPSPFTPSSGMPRNCGLELDQSRLVLLPICSVLIWEVGSSDTNSTDSGSR